MNESLPASENACDFIRSDRALHYLRGLLLEGAVSPVVGAADGADFAELRRRAKQGGAPTR